jgi:hypothetical protein
MKLMTDDLFIKLHMLSLRSFLLPVNKIEKKFISLNWRYTTHRHIIAAYLKSIDSAFITWKYKSDSETFCKNLWFDIEDWKTIYPVQYDKLATGLTKLYIDSPLTLDTKEPPIDITKNHKSYPLQGYQPEVLTFMRKSTNDTISDFYTKAFVSIVNESRYAQPTGNFSEKVIQAILHKLPFILVAPPYTLKYMREMGFKTFSDFWDESYDEITCHSERMIKILELIDHINNKSIIELESLKESMQDIVKYNHALVNVMSYNLYTIKS